MQIARPHFVADFVALFDLRAKARASKMKTVNDQKDKNLKICSAGIRGIRF